MIAQVTWVKVSEGWCHGTNVPGCIKTDAVFVMIVFYYVCGSQLTANIHK